MAKNQRNTQRGSDKDKAWLKDLYGQMLGQLYGNLKKECPELKPKVLDKLCSFRNVPGHYRQRLESDGKIWKRIHDRVLKEVAGISIETRGLAEQGGH